MVIKAMTQINVNQERLEAGLKKYNMGALLTKKSIQILLILIGTVWSVLFD